MDRNYDILIKQLLNLTFPYKEILKKQLDTATHDTILFDDVVKFEFHPDYSLESLPQMLMTVPISWQLYPAGGCLGCDLFVVNGYIECLQIIDYACKGFDWEELSKCIPVPDVDYDTSNLYQCLSGEVELKRIAQYGHYIDIAIAEETVVCFHCYAIHRLNIENAPCTKNLQIHLLGNAGTLCATDGSIDIAFDLAFLRKHMLTR